MVDFPTDLWFHDIFDEDGTPHDASEVEFIRMMNNVVDFVRTGDLVGGVSNSDAVPDVEDELLCPRRVTG